MQPHNGDMLYLKGEHGYNLRFSIAARYQFILQIYSVFLLMGRYAYGYIINSISDYVLNILIHYSSYIATD
jgi:hypothetical protein